MAGCFRSAPARTFPCGSAWKESRLRSQPQANGRFSGSPSLTRKNNVVSGAEVIKKRFVVNPSEITSVVDVARADFASFRTAIDEMTASGSNTDEAEAKYRDAGTAIQNAETSVAASKFTEAQGYAANAETLITQGRGLLDKASAEKTVLDAQHSWDKTDEIITYFKVNRSMGSDRSSHLSSSRRMLPRRSYPTQRT